MGGSNKAGLLFVGWLLGFGSPFFLIGTALLFSGSSISIEIVKDR